MKGTGRGGENWADYPQRETNDAKVINEEESSMLKKTAVNHSETLVNIYQTTRNNILYLHTNEYTDSKRDRIFLD